MVEGVTEIWQRVEPATLLLLGPSPKYSITAEQSMLPHAGEHLRLCPFLCNRCAKTKIKMAQMKEQIKATEIIQLSSEQVAKLSDAQFKTLVVN